MALFDLSYEWRILASLEGGEALIRLAEDSPWIEVSFPRQAFKVVDVMNPRTNRAEPTILDDGLVNLLEITGIQVDRSIEPKYIHGPSDDEAIVTFCLETAGQL
jgi:hypothetical protein